MRKIFLFFLLTFFIIVSIFQVSAVGITFQEPRKLDFYPDLEFTRSLKITNKLSQPMNITLSLEGNLVEYATLSKKWMIVKSGGREPVILTVKLPETLERPGLNNIGIVARENPIGPGAVLGAYGMVKVYYNVYAPYPGKYITTSLKVPNIKEREEVIVLIDIKNKGKEDLNSIFSTLSIYDINNNKLESRNTNQLSLKSQESGQLSVKFNQIFPPGEYHVLALTNYDGETKEDSTTFHVGTLSVDILNFTKLLEINTISNFDIYIQSKWNDPIDNVYAEVIIKNLEQQEVAQFKTPPENLAGFQVKKLEGFFNSDNIIIGDYIADITVYYTNKTTKKTGAIQFVEKIEKADIEEANQLELFNKTNILTLVIIAMFMMMFFMFVWVVRNKPDKNLKK